MTHYSVRVETRTFESFHSFSLPTLRPLRWSWKSEGGSSYAELAIDGTDEDLWESLQLLRCPVTIYADNDPVWWGFISDVGFTSGSVDVSVSLAGMSNKIAVTYSYRADPDALVGVRQTTTWATDTKSADEYGTRELLISLDGRTPTEAEAVRDRALELYKYPAPNIQARGVKNRVLSVGQYNRGAKALRGAGRIVCLGWWNTLSWRYYANASTASVETTTQLSDIANWAEFLTGADIIDASGRSSSEFREGDFTADSEVWDLLQIPDSSGNKMHATISHSRRMTIYRESAPDPQTDWVIVPSGNLQTVRGTSGIAGESRLGWANLRGIISPMANLDYMASPSTVYIDENEFDVNEQTYRWQVRGIASPWDIGRIVEG